MKSFAAIAGQMYCYTNPTRFAKSLSPAFKVYSDKAMQVAKKISIFMLNIGWCLIVLAAFPSEGLCLEPPQHTKTACAGDPGLPPQHTKTMCAGDPELPDAPQPQNTLPGNGNNSQSEGNKNNGPPAVPSPQTSCVADKSSQQTCQAVKDQFVTGGKAAPLTPKGKLILAGKDIIDPFNFLTIAADSAIAIGSDAHSPYGPGMAGFGKYAGVALTGDMTGEFFGTFLVPSLTRQDPRYHRMQGASIPRRIGHTIIQVVWTKGDNGHNMPNYGTAFGLAAANIFGNFYVPGQHTSVGSTAARWATGMATAPIDNILTEFLPDVARHINLRVVLLQRIMNSAAKPGAL